MMFCRLPSEEDERDLTGRRDIRAYGPLRRAAWLARRAIMAVKLRRLRGELVLSAMPVADAARWPQPPLILGDKWDF